MFESVFPDRGADGLKRAVRIFEVLAVLGVLIAALAFVLRESAGYYFTNGYIGRNLAFALLAYATAKGIEARQSWAKWLGCAQALLALVNVPVGTIVGIALLVYLYRAARGGLL